MAPRKPRVIGQTVKPIDAYSHDQGTDPNKRLNNPTQELERFARPEFDELQEALYERDESLDPQLVWRRKYAEPLDDYLRVQVRPIFTQEKIAPELLIKDLRRESTRAREAQEEAQINLFEDRFNGIPFEQKVEFYQHDVKWANRMILGDSLLAMASLAQKEGLKGKVQMIYMDPPYGIKFGSNWQVSTRKRDVKDGKTDDLTRQPEQIKAFRDTWELGIHSYLSYLRDRFTVARELLTESGSIFVQIGDENVHLVRCVLDEVFGPKNFVSMITFKKTNPLGASGLAAVSDYLLWYSKDSAGTKFRKLLSMKRLGREGLSGYSWVDEPSGSRRRLSPTEMDAIVEIPEEWHVFAPTKLTAAGLTPSCVYPFGFQGRSFNPRKGTSWRTNPVGMKRVIAANRLVSLGDSIYAVMYFQDYPVTEMTGLWADTRGEMEMSYVVQSSRVIVERCMLMTTDPGDLVLDPTCGSGTTAYVAEQWGRRWITTDTSRVALALARTRLMTAKFPFYYLADSAEGKRQEAKVTGQPPSSLAGQGDIRQGFVYKRVPHVTLKSIANNPEIDTIHDQWQPECDRLRAAINAAAGKSWEEWEIPREMQAQMPALQALLQEWWEVRRKRQAEIDQSIADHADQEYLFDKPYEDTSRIRVAGPFTVESLNPHRLVAATVQLPQSEAAGQLEQASGGFERFIIEKLTKQGVKGHTKQERIVFGRLDPLPGRYLHATGKYMEGTVDQDVAVSVGPETGTVTADILREAAKEAQKGAGHDLLIVTGFSFDGHASQMAQDLSANSRLTVLLVRMADDLLIRNEAGESSLKDLKSDNLFMAYGEPDIEIVEEEGQYRVWIHGLDVYEPGSGAVRSCGTEEIACWFVDTNYNDEAFFVRHAYFLGAGEPYEKLKKALKADIDEAIWDSCYSASSRPFPKPETGKIAIKVINHYGDEVLQVREVG